MDSTVYKLPQATSKKCARCDSIYSFHEFTVDKSKKDGRSIYCRNCGRKANRAAKAKPQAKAKRRVDSPKYREYNRNYSLKSRYGITLDQYNAIFESQDSRCAVCKANHSSGPGNGFVVDHCHKSGKVRGILCNLCNVALGSSKEDVSILKEMIKYLEGDF